MTQPLHFTTKAIEGLLSHECPDAPGTKVGMQYLAAKLREAQVFVLPDHGELLDRSKPRPEVPLAVLKPSFPVVALEYTARTKDWDEGEYTYSKSSKRIALAWEYGNDWPPMLRQLAPPFLPAGVVIASICWYDEHQIWLPVCGAVHLAYDETWKTSGVVTPFTAAAVASGRISSRIAAAPSFSMTPLPLLPEVCIGTAQQRGGFSGLADTLSADLMDEVNAYVDLQMALSCRNVSARENPAPKNLNRNRIKAGKLPLKGFHVLELGGGEMGGIGTGAGDRATARSHLRRGHIRRLAADRVTWVNSTIVRGRGFVDKVYAA